MKTAVHSFIHYTSRKLLSVSLVSLLLIVLVSCLCETPTEPNQAPTLTNQTLLASETISDTEDIGRVTASDSKNSALTFAIVTNDPNVTFEFSSNGILGLGDGQLLDYDRATNHVLVVSVFDGELSNTATVTVVVRSNQAPILTITNFRIAETIFETNVIGRIEAVSEGAREVFSYRVVSNTNLFELDTNSGGLSLVAGQFLDYERTNRHSLAMGVFDGELSNTLTISVEVEDVSLANGDAYCGDLTEMAPVIDGSENSFFLSGTGISNAPYTLPVKPGCRNIIFIYDPNYTNGTAPDIHFRITGLNVGGYRGYVSNVETIAVEEGEGRWDLISDLIFDSILANGILSTIRFTSGDSGNNSDLIQGGDETTNDVPFNTPKLVHYPENLDFFIETSSSSTAWVSKKGLLFYKLDIDP